MKPVQKILNKFNGLHYPQEYLCLAKESFQQPLHAFLLEGNRVIDNITDSHLFVGYSPLILALRSRLSESQHLADHITIALTTHSHQPNEFLLKKDAIACLSLKMIRRQMAGDIEIVYYEGAHGEHHFLSAFHQYIIGLNNRLNNKKATNVFLHDNLYKQVQIAYSVPRIISLITVSDGKSFNLFPTDLHGTINERYYIGSLRHAGRACQQVNHSKKIVISTIHYSAYKLAYSLGKNHMQDLKPRENFPFGDDHSAILQLPLPQPALHYRELECIECFDHGIHQLILYKILSEKTVNDEPATLAHIHNVYATWRHNKGLSGNYLLR